MNNIKDLASQYLKFNKKRSLVTVFGISLAVVLFFTLINLFYSTWNCAINSERINFGDYEVYADAIDSDTYKKLLKDSKIDKIFIKSIVPQKYPTYLKSNTNTFDYQEVQVGSFDEKMMGITLIEGDMPKKANEIILCEEDLGLLGNPKVGEEFDINLEMMKGQVGGVGEDKVERINKKVTYKLAGVYKLNNLYGYDVEVCTIYMPMDVDHQPTYCEGDIKLKSTSHIAKDITYLKKTYGINVTTSSVGELYFENVDGTDKELINLLLYIVVFIAFWFMMLVSVLIIRNAFMMSVTERTRDYGILKCIGMSKKQLRNMLMWEGLLMSTIAIVVGIILSYILLIIIRISLLDVLKSFRLDTCFHIGVYPKAVLITVGFTVFATLFSLIEPARQVGLISPIDAMKGTKSVKKEKIFKIKHFGLIKLIFGIEGEYAYKNIMRNRGKFISALFGMLIGITVFVGICSCFMYTKDLLLSGLKYYDGEIYLSQQISNEVTKESLKASIDKTNKYFNEISKMEEVKDSTVVYTGYADVLSDKLFKSDEGHRFICCFGYGKEEIEKLKSSLVEGEIDYDNMKDNEVIVCNYAQSIYYDDNGQEKIAYNKETNLKVGDKIKVPQKDIFNEYCRAKDGDSDFMSYKEYFKKYKGEYKEVTVKAIIKVDQVDLDRNGEGSSQGELIYTKAGFINNNSNCGENQSVILYKLKKENDYLKINEYINDKYELTNYDYYEEERTILLTMKLVSIMLTFVVGIILVICMLNTFSNMTSNIVARKRELDTYEVVGMSNKQITKMLVLENILASIIAVILGCGLGIYGGKAIFDIISESMHDIKFQIPVLSIIIVAIGTIGITLLVTLQIAKNRKK